MCLPVYRLLCIDYRDLKYRFVNTTTKLIDRSYHMYDDYLYTCRAPDTIKVITKLPNSEQSYKGKVKTHNYINRQNQSTTGKL